MVALVTILLNNSVSGEGPKGIEGLLPRGKSGGRKRKTSVVYKQEEIQVCRVNIKKYK